MVKPLQAQQPPMIIKIPVIGTLTFHELFNVEKGPLALHKFPVEQLQFPPCPFDPVPAPVDFHLSGFGQGEPGLAEPERLCQGNHLSLFLVHPDPFGFKAPYNFMAHQFCFLNGGKNQKVIIHVMPITVNTGLALDPVVNRTWKGNHFLL